MTATPCDVASFLISPPTAEVEGVHDQHAGALPDGLLGVGKPGRVTALRVLAPVGCVLCAGSGPAPG
jgi:hypothetical protein